MFWFRGLSLVIGVGFVWPSFASDSGHGSSPAAPKGSKIEIGAERGLEPEDAKVIADALALEMGDSCVGAGDESPRVKVSLANIRSISESMIAQFTKMVQDDIAEKRGPIKIGPPEIMDQVLSSTGNMHAFAQYHGLLKNTGRGESQSLRRQKREAFEKKIVGAYAGREEVSLDSMAKAAELASGLFDIVQSPKTNFGRTRIQSDRDFLGVTVETGGRKFFGSMESVAPALPVMNAFLDNEASGLKRDTALVNAMVDGLVLSVPTALISVARTSIASSIAKNAGSSISGSALASGGGSGVASVPVQVLLMTTLVTTVGNDLRTVATTLGNAEFKTRTKEVIGISEPMVNARAKLAKDPKDQGELSKEKIEETLLVSLPLVEGADAKRIDVPTVSDPSRFTKSITAIRDATRAYLNDHQRLRNSHVGSNVEGSSAVLATVGTLEDTKASNDALMLNMQSFYNTSRRARADYLAMAKILQDSQKNKVKHDEVDRLSSTLDSDLNLMLEKMDDSASILANQSDYFNKGISYIESACAEDAKRVFDSWGKYRRVIRDKLALSPVASPVSPAKAYLSEALLSRADCLTKKSIARHMEMMRIGTVLTQFKSSCEDVKKWSAAGKAYKNARTLLLRKTKENATSLPAMPRMPEVSGGN